MIAVHAKCTRSMCSQVGHLAASAICLLPVESLRALGTYTWRSALMARNLSTCLAMDDILARQHPSRAAAFLPCSRPPDSRVSWCFFRPTKTRSGRDERARRRAHMSDTVDLKHEADDAGDTPLSSGDTSLPISLVVLVLSGLNCFISFHQTLPSSEIRSS